MKASGGQPSGRKGSFVGLEEFENSRGAMQSDDPAEAHHSHHSHFHQNPNKDDDNLSESAELYDSDGNPIPSTPEIDGSVDSHAPQDLFERVMQSGKKLVYDPSVGQFLDKKAAARAKTNGLHGNDEDFHYVKFMKRERNAMQYKLNVLMKEQTEGAQHELTNEEQEKEAGKITIMVRIEIGLPDAILITSPCAEGVCRVLIIA